MTVKGQKRLGMLLAAGLLTIAGACGDDDGGGGATSGGAATPAGAGESSNATAEAVSFQFAMGSPGLSGALLQETLARVNEKYGHDAEWVELADSDLVVQGAAQGQFQMGSSTTSSVMKVIQDGAPLTFVSELSRNQWTLMAKNDIADCADMDGVRLGLHSPGGVSTALYRAWYQRNCDTGVEPDELYIEGSPNRLQALLAGQVDVAMIELEDTLDLPEGDYTMLANFTQDLRDIKVGLVYANDGFIEEHPEVVQQVVNELTALQKEVNEDPALFEELIGEYVPETGEKTADAVAAYLDVGMIPDDGGFLEDEVQASIDLYTEAGVLQPGLTAADVMDRTFLETALAAS